MPVLQSPETGSSPARRMSLPVKLLVALAIVAGIVVGAGSFFIGTFRVPTGSMENAIMSGDAILVALWDQEPARGKIIVFDFPGMRDEIRTPTQQMYIKRCVALPGDTLELRDNNVYINGVMQPPPGTAIVGKIPEIRDDALHTFPIGAYYTHDNWGPMRVPKKGDRLVLNDSSIYTWQTFIGREGHSVQRNGDAILIDGRTVKHYVVERDYCFGMGDNRDNSLDSRYWGFIPVESITGTPRWVYWSYDSWGEPGGVRWGRIFKTVE